MFGRVLTLLILLAGGCSIEERADFLIGRRCGGAADCDPGQSCLPHTYEEPNGATDYRCRDAASFDVFADRNEPPLAYCEPGKWECPEGVSCVPDRVRSDVGVRRLVCRVVASE